MKTHPKSHSVTSAYCLVCLCFCVCLCVRGPLISHTLPPLQWQEALCAARWLPFSHDNTRQCPLFALHASLPLALACSSHPAICVNFCVNFNFVSFHHSIFRQLMLLLSFNGFFIFGRFSCKVKWCVCVCMCIVNAIFLL